MSNQPFDCTAALQTLATGRLADWPGLHPSCSRAAAEAALGDTGDGPGGVADLAGELTSFRDYPATEFAPLGLTVWLALDTIIVVQINQPRLPGPLDDLLGSPEAELDSLLTSYHRQWAYPARGLTFHVNPNDRQEILRLYAFAPMSLAQFEDNPLSRVAVRRYRW